MKLPKLLYTHKYKCVHLVRNIRGFYLEPPQTLGYINNPIRLCKNFWRTCVNDFKEERVKKNGFRTKEEVRKRFKAGLLSDTEIKKLGYNKYL